MSPRTMENAMRNQILHDYAENRGKFTLFDFGLGKTESPVIKDGMWLTRTVTYPMLRGTEKPTYDGPLPKEGEVIAMGNGWFVTAVEITHLDDTEELSKKLSAAEVLLLKIKDAWPPAESEQAKSAGG